VTRTVDQLLEEARSRLRRLDPPQAAAAVRAGALLVDIRPAAQRSEEGEVPGAIVVERNVLEWRLDPASAHRLAEVDGYDQPVVVMCSEGYTSSLAAAASSSQAPASRMTEAASRNSALKTGTGTGRKRTASTASDTP
jgi:rhodanese-related sulfurtransferase